MLFLFLLFFHVWHIGRFMIQEIISLCVSRFMFTGIYKWTYNFISKPNLGLLFSFFFLYITHRHWKLTDLNAVEPLSYTILTFSENFKENMKHSEYNFGYFFFIFRMFHWFLFSKLPHGVSYEFLKEFLAVLDKYVVKKYLLCLSVSLQIFIAFIFILNRMISLCFVILFESFVQFDEKPLLFKKEKMTLFNTKFIFL